VRVDVHAANQANRIDAGLRATVTRMTHGVKINGKAWARGTGCIWLDTNNYRRYGIVQEFNSWVESSGSVWCVRVIEQTILREDHCLLYTEDMPEPKREFIFWQQLRFLCKFAQHETPMVVVKMYATKGEDDWD
jgi:hypothetical protein